MASNFLNSVAKLSKPTISPFGYLYPEADIKFSVARLLLTGIIKNQFYRSESDIIEEASIILNLATKSNPDFVLKAAHFARNSNMKGMVILAIAYLYVNAPNDFLTANKDSIVSLLATFSPNNLVDFMSIFKKKILGKGLGSKIQKVIQDVIVKSWTINKVEDYALKHPQAISELITSIHPKLPNEVGNVVHYTMSKSKKYPTYGKANTEKQLAVEKIKNSSDQLEIAKLISEYKIPHDAVKSIKGYNKGLFGASLVSTMSLMALLKNIETFSSVFSEGPNGYNLLQARLKETRKGRFIPIDYVRPYMKTNDKNIKNIILNELSERLDGSFPAIETLSIGVSVDVSGSMQGEPLLTAGLLAFPFVKAAVPWFTTFNTTCSNLSLPTNTDDKLKKLISLQANGGTDISSPILQAICGKVFLDLLVIITDEQQNFGYSVSSAWNEYKQRVNGKAQLWIVNASNNTLHVTDMKDNSITIYQSMSSQIFNNIEFLNQDLVSVINAS